MKKIINLALVCVLQTFAFAQKTYKLDKNHAGLAFSAVHLGISHIEGDFKKFDVSFVSVKEDFTDAQIDLAIDAASINTEVDARDTDLRDNWFEVKKFPALSFKSTSFEKVNGKNYKLKGNFTTHGVTKPIEFDVVFNGKAQSPFAKKSLYGFTITGKLNRSDFGLGADPLTTGVSDEIQLRSNVEFIIN